MNQTFFIGNPVVRDHTGKGLANSVAEELEKVCSKKSLASQLVGGGTDGQYFTLGVPQILKDTLGLHKAFFTWDPVVLKLIIKEISLLDINLVQVVKIMRDGREKRNKNSY